MLHVCTLLWRPNGRSRDFSRCYDETWVEKLYRGFRRNLSGEFRFVCFVDQFRTFSETAIEQEKIKAARPDYGTCIEPYRLGEPMILVGLDTVIVGNIDHLAKYCLTAKRPAYPLDPYHPHHVCNGVGLIPAGHSHIATKHRGENDMDWVRKFPHSVIDRLFPGQVLSWKGHVEKHGPGDARVIYFHGQRKMHQLSSNLIIREHWV